MSEDEVKKIIGKLRTLSRRDRGAQTQLAKDLGVRKQRLNDWLVGRRTPNLKSWLKIRAFIDRKGKNE